MIEQVFGHEDIASNYKLCLEAAADIIEDAPHGYKGRLKDDIHSVAATLMIQWSRTRYMTPLTPEMAGGNVSGDGDDDGSESSQDDDLPF
jgi:hypothetical protein